MKAKLMMIKVFYFCLLKTKDSELIVVLLKHIIKLTVIWTANEAANQNQENTRKTLQNQIQDRCMFH